MRILIQAGAVRLTATLEDNPTAQAVWQQLPLRATAQLWGREVYFTIPLRLGAQNPQSHAEPGTVAYWEPGPALCLFFGQTPASPVTPIGRIQGDPNVLAAVREGDLVVVDRAD